MFSFINQSIFCILMLKLFWKFLLQRIWKTLWVYCIFIHFFINCFGDFILKFLQKLSVNWCASSNKMFTVFICQLLHKFLLIFFENPSVDISVFFSKNKKKYAKFYPPLMRKFPWKLCWEFFNNLSKYFWGISSLILCEFIWWFL